MTSQEGQDLVDATLAKLSEHFDAVQILVSWPADGGGTRAAFRGAGNWYSRQGMAHKFITDDVADENAARIGKVIGPPPDEGDGWKAPL